VSYGGVGTVKFGTRTGMVVTDDWYCACPASSSTGFLSASMFSRRSVVAAAESWNWRCRGSVAVACCNSVERRTESRGPDHEDCCAWLVATAHNAASDASATDERSVVIMVGVR